MSQDDELQNDDVIIEEPQNEDAGSAPEDSTSSAELGENQDDVAKGDDPDRFAKRINKKHYELMQERRARQEAEEKLRKYEQAQVGERPDIPPMPDHYDDDFEAQVKARDKAIADAAAYDARQAEASRNEQARLENQRVQQEREINEAVTEYSQKAEKVGIKPEDLQIAGQLVAAYGISPELTSFILTDDDGPMLTMYLSKNPQDLEKIQSAGSMRAVSYIESQIRPKLSSAKNENVAPKPADTLQGGGFGSDEDGPPGATYE